MRLVYLGTPSFAVPSLERLAEKHEVLGVFTQPDRPKGRGQKDAMSPVKEAALRLGLAVHQPERVRRPEVVEQLRAMAPEVMVVVGYGQIIPQSILDIPPQGIINVHASLLPKYRGAAPIQWAIANGEKVTGITTMKIDAGLDTGAMLLKWATQIEPEETAVDLSTRLAPAGADLLIETLRDLADIVPEAQDNNLATLAPILKKEDGHVDWNLTSTEILNRARGFQPWPGAYGFLKGLRFHVWRGVAAERSVAPGRLIAEGKRLFAGCGGGAIELLEVQLEGKKRMPASAFLNGFSLAPEEVLQ